MDPLCILPVVILLVVFSGYQALPLLVLALNPHAIRFSFESDQDTRDLLRRTIHLREWLDRLKDLGFTLLGQKVEKIPLWGPAFRELALVSAEAEAHAGIVLHPDGTPASLYFYTPIRNGGMVFTRNFQGPEAEGERLSVRNVEHIDFRFILNDHLARVRSFRDRGLIPRAGATQAERLAATAAFYDSEYGRTGLPSLWSPPIRMFALALALLVAATIWIFARQAAG